MRLDENPRSGPVLALVLVAVVCAGTFAWRLQTGPDRQVTQARAAILAEPQVASLTRQGARYQVFVRRGAGLAQVQRIWGRVLTWEHRREDQGRALRHPAQLAMGPARIDVVEAPAAPSQELFAALGAWNDPQVVSATLSPQDVDLRVRLAPEDGQALVLPAGRVAARLGRLEPRLRSALDSVSMRWVDGQGSRIWVAEGAFATRLPARALRAVARLQDLDPGVTVTRGEMVKVSLADEDGTDIEADWQRVQEALGDEHGYWVQVTLGGERWAGNPQGRPTRLED